MGSSSDSEIETDKSQEHLAPRRSAAGLPPAQIARHPMKHAPEKPAVVGAC
jgi:hypothetical protein